MTGNEMVAKEPGMVGFSREEAVRRGAQDTIFFGFYFFPKTCRQEVSDDHYKLVQLFRGEQRIGAAKCFRGFAKTSWARVEIAARISYGLSNTMVFVSETEGAAVKTLAWLKKAILENKLWSDTFGLAPKMLEGKNVREKWEETWITVRNETLGIDVNIIALGVTGQSRGVNIDDFRPDFILVDDPCDEENTKTEEQREKINSIVMGSILNSLAPASENPLAKMVVLQTPLEQGDLIDMLMKDPTVDKLRVSCFTENGESSWPARWSTEVLQQQKQAATARSQLRLWMREMEVTVVQGDKQLLREAWLQDFEFFPDGGYHILAIDPTPPPKNTEKEPNKKLDDAVIQVWLVTPGKTGPHFWLREEHEDKSPDLFQFADLAIDLAIKYRCLWMAVETINFQRALKSVLDNRMKLRGRVFRIKQVEDRRNKILRITQDCTEAGYDGRIHVQTKFTKLREEWIQFPYAAHDDHPDCAAIAIKSVDPVAGLDTSIEGEYRVVEDDYPDLEVESQCP